MIQPNLLVLFLRRPGSMQKHREALSLRARASHLPIALGEDPRLVIAFSQEKMLDRIRGSQSEDTSKERVVGAV